MKQAEYYVNQKQYQDYILNFIDKNINEALLKKLGSASSNSTLYDEFKKGFVQGMMFASMLTCKVKTACIEIPEEEKPKYYYTINGNDPNEPKLTATAYKDAESKKTTLNE